VRITVRCFSHVRDALGADSLEIEIPEGARARAVEERIRQMAGRRLEGIPLRLARNRAFVEPAEPLADGDEVSLLPPARGG